MKKKEFISNIRLVVNTVIDNGKLIKKSEKHGGVFFKKNKGIKIDAVRINNPAFLEMNNLKADLKNYGFEITYIENKLGKVREQLSGQKIKDINIGHNGCLLNHIDNDK